jgi:hypothetical protein
MELIHTFWPFFAPDHQELASALDEWVSADLSEFEDDEGEPIEDEDGFIPAQFSGDSFERIILHYQARAEDGPED